MSMNQEQIRQEMLNIQSIFLSEVISEREYQYTTYGRDSHSPELWLALINKYAGRIGVLCFDLRNLARQGVDIEGQETQEILEQLGRLRRIIAALMCAWEEQVYTRHLGLEEGEAEEIQI